MARRNDQAFIEARVEAVSQAADQAPANRLVFWGLLAAFSCLLLSWVNAL